MLYTEDLFDLSHTIAADYLRQFHEPWRALEGIRDWILAVGPTLGGDYVEREPNVWVHRTATVFPSAYIVPPCIIGPGAEVRHCAFIRGSVLIGENCVVGNSCELKNVILFDAVEVPHFNYVGDSILGFHSHMGAGSITSNVKGDKEPIVIHAEKDIPTGLKKMGAMLGDWVEVGCNSVLNPGTVVGRKTNIYPLTSVRGVIGPGSIVKSMGNIVKKQENDGQL